MQNMFGENATSSPSGQASQPKMWKDLSVDEKLERMREQIKYVQQQAVNAINESQNVRNDLQNHDHLNGKIVKDIKTYNSIGLSGIGKALHNPKAEAEGNVYF